jgi:hypothetical protein
MGLFSRVAAPLRGYRLLRRLLVEARGIRRALERQADALELHAGAVPRESIHGQVFRSYARTKAPLSEREVQDLTEVSYVDDQVLASMMVCEDELRALLGRDPSPEEIQRAYAGEIE